MSITTFSTVGYGSWTVPAGITSINVCAFAAGAGGANYTSGYGIGGGGGSYSVPAGLGAPGIIVISYYP